MGIMYQNFIFHISLILLTKSKYVWILYTVILDSPTKPKTLSLVNLCISTLEHTKYTKLKSVKELL